MKGRLASFLGLICCVFASAVGCASRSERPPANPQQAFSAPDKAATALVDAVRRGDRTRLLQILGPKGDDILASGDPVADRADAAKFLDLYAEKHSVAPGDGGDNWNLVVGNGAWPFPVPIIKSGRKFIFDTETGREEILDRRIGRNELAAQQVCLAIVDAQRDYVATRPMGGEFPEYAQKVISDAGSRNGLYWPPVAGQPGSP